MRARRRRLEEAGSRTVHRQHRQGPPAARHGPLHAAAAMEDGAEPGLCDAPTGRATATNRRRSRASVEHGFVALHARPFRFEGYWPVQPAEKTQR